MYNPQHGISERALEADWNVFVWSGRRICMGWHIDSQLPITFSNLYHWITLLYSSQLPNPNPNPKQSQFDVKPVDIVSDEMVTYTVVPTGGAIPRDSRGRVGMGDYCIYNVDGSPMAELRWAKYRSCSFADLIRYAQRLLQESDVHPDIFSMTKLPSRIEDEILERDISCALTGAKDNLIVHWIYPPWANFMLVPRPRAYPGAPYIPVPEKDFDPWLVVTNYFRLSEDVAELFRDNVLCIDVDDNYRIVFLTNHTTTHLPRPLQTHYIPPPPGANRPSDDFLREHFKQSLFVHSGGGDMLDDYSTGQIDAIIEKLGVDGDNLNIDLSHRLWGSAIGKEIFRFLGSIGVALDPVLDQ